MLFFKIYKKNFQNAISPNELGEKVRLGLSLILSKIDKNLRKVPSLAEQHGGSFFPPVGPVNLQ